MAQDIKVETVGSTTCEPTGGFNHRTLKYAPLDWFETIGAPKPICDPTPANEATTFAEMAEITADHTFKTGYGFMNITGVQELTSIESPMIGEKRRRLFENKASFTVPGSDAELLGFTRWIKNRDGIFLLTEVESGRTRQIGSERMAAMVAELTGKVEGEMEGDNSQLFTISDKQVYQAPIYLGTITNMPAQV